MPIKRTDKAVPIHKLLKNRVAELSRNRGGVPVKHIIEAAVIHFLETAAADGVPPALYEALGRRVEFLAELQEQEDERREKNDELARLAALEEHGIVEEAA